MSHIVLKTIAKSFIGCNILMLNDTEMDIVVILQRACLLHVRRDYVIIWPDMRMAV